MRYGNAVSGTRRFCLNSYANPIHANGSLAGSDATRIEVDWALIVLEQLVLKQLVLKQPCLGAAYFGTASAAGAAALIACKRSAETQEQGGGQNPPDEQHDCKRLETHHGIRPRCLQAKIVPTDSCGFKGEWA